MSKSELIHFTSSPTGYLTINKFSEGLIEVPTFLYGDKPCWIATDVLNRIGYKDSSKSLNRIIRNNEFQEGFEHKVVKGTELAQLKKLVTAYEEAKGITEPIIDKKVPNIIVFFTSGLVGFLTVSRFKGVDGFQKWNRREVIPSILKYGLYVTDPLLRDENLLVERLNKLIEDKNQELQAEKKEYEKLSEEHEKLSEEHESQTKEFKFAVMLRADAEYELERERKKNRKLREKVRSLKPQTDEYGNKLTPYEIDHYE